MFARFHENVKKMSNVVISTNSGYVGSTQYKRDDRNQNSCIIEENIFRL